MKKGILLIVIILICIAGQGLSALSYVSLQTDVLSLVMGAPNAAIEFAGDHVGLSVSGAGVSMSMGTDTVDAGSLGIAINYYFDTFEGVYLAGGLGALAIDYLGDTYAFGTGSISAGYQWLFDSGLLLGFGAGMTTMKGEVMGYTVAQSSFGISANIGFAFKIK